MRTLSSLLRRQVVTESGRPLGRLYDLRGELTGSNLRITGLCIGHRALLEHLGIRPQKPHTIIPWETIIRIEGKRIVVRDDAAPAAAGHEETTALDRAPPSPRARAR